MLAQIESGQPPRYETPARDRGIGGAFRRIAMRRRRTISALLTVFLGILALATGSPAHAATVSGLTCQNHLYTVNSYANNVSVIDTNTNEVTATIPVGKSPGWEVFTPDKKQLYVSDNADSSISVIDTATNKVVKTIPTAAGPIGLAFTPDGKRLIVSYIQGTLNSINVATGEATDPIKVGTDPEQIRITADGKYVYLASSLQGIYKVDVDQMRVVAVIPPADFKAGAVPFIYNLTISPDGTNIYVAAIFGGVIADIDTRTDRVVKTWPAKGPVGLQLSADQQQLYVTNFFGASIDEYSTATGALLRTSGKTDISLPSHAATSADGRYLYFGQSFDTKLEVFDTLTWKPVKTLTVGSGPNSLAICDSASPR